MIIELPNILDQETCQQFVKWYEDNPQFLRKDDAQDRFNDCTIYADDIQGVLRQKFEALKTRLLIATAKHFECEELYMDYFSLNKWSEGKFMDFHADNVTDKREPHWYCWWRDVSAILYLNHDFSGGNTVFKNQNQAVVPTTGTAVIFPATYSYTHGVQKITKGDRYTLAFWMTKNRDYCWTPR